MTRRATGQPRAAVPGAGGTPAWARPTALEVASGLVLGLQRQLPPAPRAVPGGTPRAALEAAVVPALQRPPCVVSFSGGRDSSAVLAVASSVARREGLALPVPFSQRFPEVPDADERGWQEAVVRHLRLDDWERRSFTDELDLLGPFASALLERYGLVYPFNAHFHAPVLDAARGGSVLTGVGGDELFGPTRWRAAMRLATARARPRPTTLAALGLALAPRGVRAAVLRHRPREDLELPWLRPRAQRQLDAAVADHLAETPADWRVAARSLARHRYLALVRRTFALMGGHADAAVVHPLNDPGFLAAVAASHDRAGPATRTAIMRELFGDILPATVLGRRDKAMLTAAFFSSHSRRFVEHWDGSGVDRELVDGEALAAAWSVEQPDARSFWLLQSVWLRQRARSAREALEQARR